MNDTTQALYETLNEGLADIDARGLRRRRRIIDGANSAHMTVDGRAMIGFASNDYLGLAAHEAIRAALAEGAALYGAGSGGSHLLGAIRALMLDSKTIWPRSRAASSTIHARSTSAPVTWRISPCLRRWPGAARSFSPTR